MHYAMMLMLSDCCVDLHCVSVIVKDQLILLSAPSGTGKTTLGNLLHRYCDSAIVNGDYALLSIGDDGQIWFEPTPFCGSSGICHNYRLTVDRIVFLEQSKENQWENLNPRDGYAQFLQNCYITDIDPIKREQMLGNALKIIERVPTSRFAFTPNEDAARMLEKLI